MTSSAQHKTRYWQNVDKERLRSRRKNWRAYGFDPDEAERALAVHAGTCEICGTTKPGGRGNWHVDHDHSTKKVRGILCLRCNAGLGQFGEDPEVFLRAARYLGKAKRC